MAFSVREKFNRVKWAEDDQPLRVVELALWSATSDGEIEDEEVTGIVETIREVPGLESFSEDEAFAMIDEMRNVFTTEEAIEERIVELATGITDPDLRRMSYQLAVWCAGSDGELSDEEEDFLDALQDEFELSDREAERLAEEVLG